MAIFFLGCVRVLKECSNGGMHDACMQTAWSWTASHNQSNNQFVLRKKQESKSWERWCSHLSPPTWPRKKWRSCHKNTSHCIPVSQVIFSAAVGCRLCNGNENAKAKRFFFCCKMCRFNNIFASKQEKIKRWWSLHIILKKESLCGVICIIWVLNIRKIGNTLLCGAVY